MYIEYILSYFVANTILNLLVGGVIGEVVVVWHLAMDVLYLLKIPHAVSKWDCQIDNPLFFSYRDTEHEADKTLPVKII